jgi:RHS repeat-associated protein
LDWTYDRTGNRLSETRLDRGAAEAEVSDYQYTPLTSRLTAVLDAAHPTDPPEHVLEYDASGNATRYDDLCLDYDKADRLTAIRRLTNPATCSDCADATCATLVEQNKYDYKFRRTERVDYETSIPDDRCTAFVYDQYDRLIAEHRCGDGSPTDPASSVLAEYVYLEGYHILAVRRRANLSSPFGWYWYANDHLPTPRKVVDETGAIVWDGRMEPFGTTNEVVADIEQPLRLAGQIADHVLPISYNWHRWFAPVLAAYTSSDPLLRQWPGPSGRSFDSTLIPALFPVFAFPSGNPLRSSDSTGLNPDYLADCLAFCNRTEPSVREQCHADKQNCLDWCRRICNPASPDGCFPRVDDPYLPHSVDECAEYCSLADNVCVLTSQVSATMCLRDCMTRNIPSLWR